MALPNQAYADTITVLTWNAVIDAINALTAAVITGDGAIPSTYDATLAYVINTTSETTILSFDVPANRWADGDIITFDIAMLAKNNKGSVGNSAVKINVGAGAQVVLSDAVSDDWIDSATEMLSTRSLRLMRVGSTVAVLVGELPGRWQSPTLNSPPGAPTSTPTNFTSTITVALKATLSAADQTFYIKPQAAKIMHFRSA